MAALIALGRRRSCGARCQIILLQRQVGVGTTERGKGVSITLSLSSNRVTLTALLRAMAKPSRAERWLQMARDVRVAAAKTRDPMSKQTMLEIAENYERLAKRLENLESEDTDEG